MIMSKEKKFIIFVVVIILIVFSVGFVLNLKSDNNLSEQNSVFPQGDIDFSKGNKINYDAFAQCLASSGAQFYGTFWCPHCQDQKKAFGSSAKYIPYIECSTPNGQEQLAVCKDKNIQGYPTWVFADGTRQEGKMSFSELSEKTKCELPK
jgi:hypothetical protein